jgi:hypothetical protein
LKFFNNSCSYPIKQHPYQLLDSSLLHGETEDDLSVMLNMLRAAKHFIGTLLRAIEFRREALKLERQRQERARRVDEVKLRMAGCGYHPMEERYGQMTVYTERIETRIKQIELRLKRLKNAAIAPAAPKNKVWQLLISFMRWWKRDRSYERVARASLPESMQFNAARRQALLNAIDGRTLQAFGCTIPVPCCCWSIVHSWKWYCFENYSSLEDEMEGSLQPISKMLKMQARSMKFGLFYLVFVTFFIFLASVRISDSITIRSILITTFTGEVSSIIMVQPVETLLLAGLIPAFAAYLIRQDVNAHMESQRAKVSKIRDLDRRRAKGHNLPANLPPEHYSDLPFEVSPQWSAIEKAAPFGKRHPNDPKGVLAGSLYISGGPAVWDFCVKLHRNGIRTTSELQEVTWGVLSKKCGINPKQVEAVWKIVRPNEEPPVRISKLVAKSTWKKLKTAAVVPVLSPRAEGGQSETRVPSPVPSNPQRPPAPMSSAPAPVSTRAAVSAREPVLPRTRAPAPSSRAPRKPLDTSSEEEDDDTSSSDSD